MPSSPSSRPASTRRASAGVAATASCALAALAASGLVAAPAAAATTPHVTELHYDNDGTDTGEAIEVSADPGTDVTGWTLVLYNGNGGAPYGSAAPVPALDADGIAVVQYPANGVQNGDPDGIALVRTDGTVAEFLSYEGVFTAVGGPADGMTSTDIGVAETAATPVGQSLQLVDGEWTGPLANTFGAPNDGGGGDPDPDPDPELPPADCDAPVTAIGAVQGSGAATPLAGQQVVVRGTVVADLQVGGYDGYHLQDAGDGDPATSDGVFVYQPDAGPEVSVGDVVTVQGTATEFNGLTQVAQLTAASVCGTGALPTPAPMDLPADDAQLERLEGMLVAPVDELTVSEVYDLNRFGEIVLSEGGRLVTPTQVAEPGDPARAVMAANRTRDVVLDDGVTANLATAGIAPPFLTLTDPVRVGDTLGTLQPSVLSYGFNEFRLQPADGTAEGTTFEATNPRTAAPDEVGGDLRVGAFNVLNYFVTFIPNVSRGADDEAAKELQEAKIVSAITALDADVIALQEIENSAVTTPDDPYAALRTLVEAINDAEGADVWDYSRVSEGSDVITNAIIYRTDRVQTVGEPVKVTEDAVWDNAREPIAQTFVAEGDVFTVIGNHLKSKGSGSGPGNADAGDGQGASNLDRVEQATALVEFAAQLAEATGDDDVLLLGDFNAYAKEDPIDVILAAGFTDLAEELAPGDYSYVFDAESGSLDHSFASPSLTEKVTGLDVWNINAEESYGYQYDGFPGLYAPNPYRASDHSPEVLGLDLQADGPTCEGLPATVVGTDASETLRGTDGDDVIVAGAGDDVVLAGAGDDVICAGAGDDRVLAGDGDDRVLGEDGDDVLYGQNGDDVLDGGAGDDTLVGGRGVNTLV